MGNDMTNDATFGQAPTFNSDVEFALAVSDDKKAFTASFAGLEVNLDPKSAAPVDSRVFTFVLPLSGATPGSEIPFFVSGFVASENGGNGHLVFSINDQSTVADFPGGSEQSFIQKLNFKVGSAPEIRLTTFLLADRDSKSDATVKMNVSTIDTDILKHEARPSPRDPGKS
jgi:hypothetical protein